MRHLPVASLLLLVSILASGCAATTGKPREGVPPLPELATLLRVQTTRYPLMGVDDFYKLIYQATRGPSHIFMGEGSDLDIGLYRETETIKPSPIEREEEIESLGGTSGLVRVNLRPFLLRGGRIDDLARAIGETNLRFRGDDAEFVASLEEADRLIPSLNVRFSRKKFREYSERMWKRDYPPGRHSAEYAASYAPAYRIVIEETLSDPDYGGREPVSILP